MQDSGLRRGVGLELGSMRELSEETLIRYRVCMYTDIHTPSEEQKVFLTM